MKALISLLSSFGIKPKDITVYQKAFTHRSYLNENRSLVESNERLEFLGDAILTFVISDYLFDKYPNHSEGILTNMRSTIVRTQTLAQLAKKMNFGQHLLLSHGEEEGGGRENISLLADTFEAFLGAIYIDLGLDSAQKFLEKALFPNIQVILKEKLNTDYKSKLQEIVQTFSKNAPTYKVIKSTGPDHAKMFWVAVVIDGKQHEAGMGKSKQEAQQQAAYKTLEKMGKI